MFGKSFLCVGCAFWSPDGSRIIFSSSRDVPYSLYQKPANGGKDEKILLKSSEDKHATSWLRDGRFLLYTVVHPKTKSDICVLPMDVGHPMAAGRNAAPGTPPIAPRRVVGIALSSSLRPRASPPAPAP